MDNSFGSSNPEELSKQTIDPTLGYVVAPEFTTLRPSDFPNLAVPDPLKEDDTTGQLRNLTEAEQQAGEVGQSTFPSSHVVTLTGGGQPNSIFAATIDGEAYYENITISNTRSLSQVAKQLAIELPLKFPYLQVTPSGNTLQVQSLKSTLTIAAPPSTLPILRVRIYLGQYVPAANDRVLVKINGYQVAVTFDGSETLPDVALNKVLQAIASQRAWGNLFAIYPWLVGDYSQSNIALGLLPNQSFTDVSLTNYGTIQMHMEPQLSQSSPITFTVT